MTSCRGGGGGTKKDLISQPPEEGKEQHSREDIFVRSFVRSTTDIFVHLIINDKSRLLAHTPPAAAAALERQFMECQDWQIITTFYTPRMDSTRNRFERGFTHDTEYNIIIHQPRSDPIHARTTRYVSTHTLGVIRGWAPTAIPIAGGDLFIY